VDAQNFAHELRDVVADLRAKGVESIQSESLIKYLDETLPSLGSPATAGDAKLELYKAELQKWVEEHKNAHAHSVELFKSVIQAGQSALRTAFLMNGGASVALLAFAGHLASIDPKRVPLVAPSLTIFVVGVLVAAIASGVTYLGQWFYASERARDRRIGFYLNVAAILLGFGAYVVFAFGMWRGYRLFARF
jgi:hypothetical protein